MNFGLTWGICQILKFYLALSCTTKSTLMHSLSIQCPRTASSIVSSLLQHHNRAVFWSLWPSLKLSLSVTLQLILGSDGKNIRQWPLYKGVGLLHYLHSIISSYEESSRPNHKDRWQWLQKFNWWWLTRCLKTSFSLPLPVSSQTHRHIFQASGVNRTIVNHAITMFCSHLINFISCINHDSLTFIVGVMGWSCGLGDSSRGDKCCYLLRARINMVCAQRDRGRAGEKEKTGHRAREPQRGCCAATNVKLSESMSAEWWMTHLHNGFDLSSLCNLGVSIWYIFSVLYGPFHVDCWAWQWSKLSKDSCDCTLHYSVVIV